MKILRKTMLIFSAVLLTTACSKSGIEEIDPNTPEHNDGTTKTLSLSVPAMIGETRAGTDASDVEKAINDVWVLQYLKADGKLFDGKAQHFTASEITDTSSGKTVSATLDDAASTVYVIANVGAAYADFAEDKVPQNLTDFEKLSYTFPAVFAEGELTSGTLPMVGSATIEAGATSVPVTLKRMVAKIDFTITVDASAPSDLKLTSAHLEYVSNKTAFKAGPTTLPTTRVQPAAADANFFDAASDKTFVYGTAKTINVSNSPTPTGGATLTWYVPENLAGQKEGLTYAKQKGPDNVPDDYCTRIVVKGTVTYNSTANTEVSFYIYPGADAIKDFNIERNKVYSITSNIKNVNKTDNRVQVHDFFDLSSATDSKCSNCYMIHKAGKYKFRCDIKGNGALVANSGITSAELATTGCAPSVIWSSTDGVNKSGNDAVITNVDIQDNYITFKTPSDGTDFVEGNAVISLKSGSTTLWSWHIWSTAYNPETNYDVYTTARTTGQKEENVMRCNLGAIGYSADGLTEPTGVDKVYGLYYQWGRKDPFLRTNGSGTGGGSVANAVANPTTFYTSSSDWTARNDNLWGNGTHSGSSTSIIYGTSNTNRYYNTNRGSKSMFDPCPAGWRVPPQYLWMNNVSAAGQAAGSPCYLTLTASTSGRAVKYIAAGRLNYSSGALDGTTSGCYWSSSPYTSSGSDAVYAGNLYFYAGNVYPLSNSTRGNGFSVRCVQE